MSFAWVGAITAIASVGMGAYSLATAPGMPDSPDLAAASRAGIEAETATLADRRRLEAAARQGTSVTYFDPAEGTQTKEMIQVSQKVLQPAQAASRFQAARPAGYVDGAPQWVPYDAADWEAGGQYADQLKYSAGNREMQSVSRPAGDVTVDFTGYGEADVQGKAARDQAQIILDLNEKYGADFIEEALKQQALADPEGTAARTKLYELIKRQADEDPERPVADLLDTQVKSQLNAGSNLDGVSDELLNEAIRQAGTSRGESYGGANFAEPMTTGFEGQAREDAAQQKALGWLTSGATPEDVEYRRNQQTMANLSDFTNNRTPQSQFQSLSGAQQGAAPYAPGPAAPQNNGSTAGATQNAALSTWNSQITQQGNEADPWMAGLSMLLSGASAAGQAGWKPLA